MCYVTNDAAQNMLRADVQRCTSYWLQNYDVRVPNKILRTIHNGCCAGDLFLSTLNTFEHGVMAFS